MFLSKILGPGHDPQMSQYSQDYVKIGTPNIE